MSAEPNQAKVSIICRTVGRPELDQALESISAQDYPNLEIILVDAAASGVVAPQTDRELQLVAPETKLARAAAANAGLDAASGELIMFLDEDDWIAPDHVSNLANCLRANPDLLAAYSSTRKTDKNGEATDYVFREPFQPLLLMRDNYIPIHAMLFSASLLNKGCRFDEQFEVYEDWDFWLQLAEHTEFHHLDQITAFYRAGGDSDTAIDDVASRYLPDHPLGQARARLFDKWMPRWGGAKLNAMLGDADKSAQLRELAATIESEHQANLQHQQQIRDLLQQFETLQHERNVAQNKLNEAIATHAAQIDALEEHARHLENLHNLVVNSISWKITRPLRGARRLLQGRPASSPDSTEDSQ